MRDENAVTGKAVGYSACLSGSPIFRQNEYPRCLSDKGGHSMYTNFAVYPESVTPAWYSGTLGLKSWLSYPENISSARIGKLRQSALKLAHFIRRILPCNLCI